MATDLISLISYLDFKESEALKQQLHQSKIHCLVNEHGAHMGDDQNVYFEIKVNLAQYKQAKKIAEQFKVSRFIKNQRCPNCKSLARELPPKLTIFQKLLYIGTTPVRCKKCKKVYGL